MSLGRANEKKEGDHHENRNVIFSEIAFGWRARSDRHCDGRKWSDLQARAHSWKLLSPEVSCDTREKP